MGHGMIATPRGVARNHRRSASGETLARRERREFGDILTHGGLNAMRVALILPTHRLALWHQRLVETLRQQHAVAVFIDDSAPAYPLPLRAWLRIERFVSG